MIRRPIVQVEFFHTGKGENVTLESVERECDRRIADGLELTLRGIETRNGIKTVLRYFDESGRVTRHAVQYQALRKSIQRRQMGYAPFWWRPIRDLRLSISYRQRDTLRKELRDFAIADIRKAARDTQGIAVERPDHSFRPASPSELHELIEGIKKSGDPWFFVFAPNHLLADSNRMLASVMS